MALLKAQASLFHWQMKKWLCKSIVMAVRLETFEDIRTDPEALKHPDFSPILLIEHQL